MQPQENIAQLLNTYINTVEYLTGEIPTTLAIKKEHLEEYRKIVNDLCPIYGVEKAKSKKDRDVFRSVKLVSKLELAK